MKEFLEKVKGKSSIITAVTVCLLTIVSLIPIFIMAKYSMPAADDYSYSITTYHAWEETHNIFAVLKSAFEKIGETYNNWQGTFSAVLLFSLQPSVFGIEFYGIGTIILVLALLFSNWYLVKTIAKKCFNYSKNSLVLILALVPTAISIQFLPDARESLFWWNGASYYTLFYSIMLIAIGVMIRVIKSEKKKNTIINMVGLILLTIIIGGGNYPTALIFIMMSFLAAAYLFITKNNKKWSLLGVTLVGIISLGISMIAPGNGVRQSFCDDSLGAIGSIFKGIYLGVVHVENWTTIPVIITFVFLTPFIYQIIKKSEFKFKYPLIFTIISFGVFAAQFVPPIYAMNNLGGSRLLDIIYYSFYWLIGLNIMYYLGWIKTRFGEIKLLDYIYENCLIYGVIILALLGAVLIVNRNYKNLTSYVSIESLNSGEAKEYYLEMLERYKLYEDKNIDTVVVPEIKSKPKQLYGADITEDKENWINRAASDYFGKKEIRIEKED